MPILIAGLLIWLTRGWWLLGLGAALGLLYALRLRGWGLALAGVALWLAVAAGVHRFPDSLFATLVQWSPATLLWVLVLALIGAGATLGLRALHRRSAAHLADAPGLVSARPVAPPDDGLDRYARHITLREIGGPGQAALKRARVLVVGAGGLARRSACIWPGPGWAISRSPMTTG